MLDEATRSRKDRLIDRLLLHRKRRQARGGQTIGRRSRQVVQSTIEMLSYLVGEMLLVHNVIPLLFNAAASVWVAREQCVLTLPSEQPIAEAVSATSMSSQ